MATTKTPKTPKKKDKKKRPKKYKRYATVLTDKERRIRKQKRDGGRYETRVTMSEKWIVHKGKAYKVTQRLQTAQDKLNAKMWKSYMKAGGKDIPTPEEAKKRIGVL